MQRDLENVNRFGLKTELRIITFTAQAAKLRVVETVAQDLGKKVSELGEAHCCNWSSEIPLQHSAK